MLSDSEKNFLSIDAPFPRDRSLEVFQSPAMHRVMRAPLLCATIASAFIARPGMPHATRLRATDMREVEDLLSEKYPSFASFLAMVQDAEESTLAKQLQGAEDGVTIFAPSEAAFEALGEKKRAQLKDVRNEETVGQIAAYHCIAEPVTKEKLYDSGGVVTMGGVLNIGTTRTGGFFGIFGGEEDGGVTINGANIVGSTEVGSSIVHEMDKLVSPQTLWRFLDMLRIPGSS